MTKIEKPGPVEVVAVKDRQRYGQMLTHQRLQASNQAEFAKDCVRLMIAAMGVKPALPASAAGGIAPAGYQPLVQMSPEEIVERAVTIAALTYERLIKDGEIVVGPTVAELAIEDEPGMGFGRTAQ